MTRFGNCLMPCTASIRQKRSCTRVRHADRQPWLLKEWAGQRGLVATSCWVAGSRSGVGCGSTWSPTMNPRTGLRVAIAIGRATAWRFTRPRGATSRKAGAGCAGPMARGLAQHRDLRQRRIGRGHLRGCAYPVLWLGWFAVTGVPISQVDVRPQWMCIRTPAQV